MIIEEVMLRRLKKFEKELTETTGTLNAAIEKIKSNLETYEVVHDVIDRISEAITKCKKLDDVKQIEEAMKHLSDTFWD